MSVIDLQVVKDRLHVVHDLDDAMLEALLNAAEDEALGYLNRTELPTLPRDWPTSEGEEEVPSSDDPVAPSVAEAICLLVKAGYDAPTGAEMAALRDVAFRMMHPFRVGLGV